MFDSSDHHQKSVERVCTQEGEFSREQTLYKSVKTKLCLCISNIFLLFPLQSSCLYPAAVKCL